MVYARDSREPADTNRDYGLCRKLPDGSLQPLGLPIWRWDTFMCRSCAPFFDGSWDNAATTRAVNYWWGLQQRRRGSGVSGKRCPAVRGSCWICWKRCRGSDNVHIFRKSCMITRTTCTPRRIEFTAPKS